MAPNKVRVALKVALFVCVAALLWNGGCSTTEPKPKATLTVTPPSVAFQDTVGQAAPAAQTLSVSADRQGAVTDLRA
ncbi:MAG: hypothetical protein J2P51_11555, partial [Hyphomicrobiaceae bacterium]|nr:hypothetical protein [Hyphomicrobiaceae bacterium]